MESETVGLHIWVIEQLGWCQGWIIRLVSDDTNIMVSHDTKNNKKHLTTNKRTFFANTLKKYYIWKKRHNYNL